MAKSAPKSATKRAVPGIPFAKGGDPRQGRGPRPGTGGRPPDEHRAKWRELATKGVDTIEAAGVMDNVGHPLFPYAMTRADDAGYGKPTQSVEVSGPGGAPFVVKLVRE